MGAAGYSTVMTVWQYAQLRVTYDNRLASGADKWTTAWHGPDATTKSTAGVYGEVIAELNRAGTEGWELVDIATLDDGDSERFSDERDWSLTRYTFRRPCDIIAAKSTKLYKHEESARAQLVITGQPTQTRDDNLAAPKTAESAGMFRLTVYRLRDTQPAGSTTEGYGLGSTAGRLLIGREVARPRSQADIDMIELLHVEYQNPDISKDRCEEIEAAAADYAASRVGDQFGATWWETPQDFPLAHAADLLNGSAEWLRELVEHPLDDAASMARVAGPIVPVGAGIMANFVTARLTEPLENAARVCEVAGIVLGMATGAHSLAIACAKRLVHDELDDVLATGFKKIIDSIGGNRKVTAESPSQADMRPGAVFETLDQRADRAAREFRELERNGGFSGRALLGSEDAALDPDPSPGISRGGPDTERD